ncbi:MAG: transporter [Chlamydiia bacterium]|nr:transporter [Chlamydiia bacterium]
MLRYLLLFLFPFALFGKTGGPWFTGPLLAPSAQVNDFRQVTWQPYFFATCTYGAFNSSWKGHKTPNTWAFMPLIDVTYGLGSFIDIESVPSFSYQMSQGSSSIRMNDTPLILGIQALRQQEGSYMPDLRIALETVFPFGQYDKGNPKKHGTDLTGSGSYQMKLSFNFQKTFLTSPGHYFRLRCTATPTLYPTPVHVEGISTYGGSSRTSGKVYPGRTYTFFVSGEYSFTQNWGFAFDTEYVYKSHDCFSGKKGDAPVGNPSSFQINLAPAIEYSYNPNLGFIGGAYFSIAGKNASQFASGTISAVVSY